MIVIVTIVDIKHGEFKQNHYEFYVRLNGRIKPNRMSLPLDKESVQKLINYFKVKTISDLKNQQFQVPEEFSQTNLAFKYLFEHIIEKH